VVVCLMSRLQIITLLVCLVLWGTSAARGDDAQFRDQVAPVLEQHCLRCHDGAKPKGGLALGERAHLLSGGESGAAVVPGKAAESLLLQYISGDKPEMPKDAPPLSAAQVAAVEKWIADGAVWPDGLVLVDKRVIDANWWSLARLSKVAPPASDDPWIRTPLDAFILARQAEHGLRPAAEADRRTLVRRLTYDLHGLPPAPEEVDAFLTDARPDAYELLVDRLLASPRYGERWGRYWLDIVHFGESHGYDKDKPRPNAWPYRDWVINSLNNDMPYDRFVAEQIAGDVLFPLDPQATIATGFISAGPWDFVGHVELREGTADKDIARSNDRDDMVANTMSTFASLTVHCARCHNHKFDPIRQEDYYALQAVFAGIDRADRPFDADPVVAAKRQALAAEHNRTTAQLAAVTARIDALTSPELAAVDATLATARVELAKLPPDAPNQTLGYHSAIMPSAAETKWVQVDLGALTEIEEVVLVPAHVAYGGHAGPGFGFPPRFKVEVADTPDFTAPRILADHTASDFAHPGDDLVRLPAAGVSGRYVRVTATRLWNRTDDWIFALAELEARGDSGNLAIGKTVTALDSIEAAPSWARANLVDGRSSLRKLDDGQPTRREVRTKEIAAAEQVRADLVASLTDAATRREHDRLTADLAAVGKQLDALPKPQQVYAAAREFSAQGSFQPPREPRPIHLLVRGDVKNLGPLVSPAAPACVQGPSATFALVDPANEGTRRAALAQWLVDPANGLTRRSIVNRVWQYHFGQGLVDSPNDFGRMGSLPTHPELLEWLTGWFIDHGHSLKQLHKLLVISAVYRQQSGANEEFARIDSGNRYLWRANRARLDAECVRDAMLAVSGKLDLAMGGPSVQQFFFKDDHSPVYDYARFDVDDPRGLRRSVYRFLVRSVPDPFMECLDCADPSIMTPKRSTTLTSIQALALLNNAFVVRQAEHLAVRLRAISSDPALQVAAGYRLALSRLPTDREAAALVEYIGQFGLEAGCRVIFNLNEFVFVD